MRFWKYCASHIVIRNVFFLLLIFFFQVAEFWTYMDKSNQTLPAFLLAQLIDSLYIMGIIVVNHLLLIRFLFEKKHYVLYILLLLLIIFAVSYLTRFNPGGWIKVNTIFFYYAYFVGAGMAVYFIHRNIIISREISEQRDLQREMELRYLKGQVNPHFLFNSLNTIYSLSRHQSNDTSDVVMQLSDLMRYQLESAKLEKVSLSHEINFISNYLMLEEQRLNDRCHIEFNVEGNVDGLSIAPMLLIPWVENAIKHGAQNIRGKSRVSAKVIMHGARLILQVINSKPVEISGGQNHTGIGLANVKRRLELLYPGRHSLSLLDDKQQYEVTLQVNLD